MRRDGQGSSGVEHGKTWIGEKENDDVPLYRVNESATCRKKKKGEKGLNSYAMCLAQSDAYCDDKATILSHFKVAGDHVLNVVISG
jgi:hypothetical protein